MTKIKQNIFANFAGSGWAALMSLVFVPLYIKFMGIESYGLIGIFASLQALFGLLDLGLSTTLNRELARLSVLPDKAQEARNLVRTLELVYWAVGLMISLVLAGLSSPIAYYWVRTNELSTSTVHQALIIMSVLIAFQWPLRFYSGGLKGLQKQVLLNILEVGIVTIRNIGAILILWLISPTIQAFFIWQLFISFFRTLLVASFLWLNLPKTGHAAHFQKILLLRNWRFATGLTGISVASLILTQTDKIILSKILTLEMFGYYALATAIAKTLSYLIGPINSALFPRFTQLVSLQDHVGLKDLYHKACQLMSVVILPPTVVVSIFSAEILLLWTRDPVIVTNTHITLSLLIIGCALNGLMHLPFGLQLSHGWLKLALYSEIIGTIVLVPMILFLTLHYGAVGAAFAWVILTGSYLLICIQIMHSRLLKGEQWQWYLNDVATPLLAALSVALLCRCFTPDQMSAYSMFALLIFVLVTSLIAAIVATDYTRFLIKKTFVKHNLLYETE